MFLIKNKNKLVHLTELEAAKAYNNIVIELNKNGCTYKVNDNII